MEEKRAQSSLGVASQTQGSNHKMQKTYLEKQIERITVDDTLARFKMKAEK